MLTSFGSYWTRCTKDAKPGPQARFKENLGLYFDAVNQQARDRDANLIPDLESYISVSAQRVFFRVTWVEPEVADGAFVIQMRRDNSGCKPVFDLIEYAMDIDLPEFVIRHPIIQALNQGANDVVTVRPASQTRRMGTD